VPVGIELDGDPSQRRTCILIVVILRVVHDGLGDFLVLFERDDPSGGVLVARSLSRKSRPGCSLYCPRTDESARATPLAARKFQLLEHGTTPASCQCRVSRGNRTFLPLTVPHAIC